MNPVRLEALLALALAAGTSACSDDEHKGTVSTGSAEPTASAIAPAETKLLVYSPGTPIATMRVAERFKRRLARAKLAGAKVKIGGEAVHVEAPLQKVEAVKKALAGGRLDLHVASTSTHPFADAAAEDVEPLRLETETVPTESGTETRRYLVGSTEQRSLLKERAQDKSLGAATFIGPAEDAAGKKIGLRSYYADPERNVRGEMVASAKAEGDVLVITFEGGGKSFLRWQGKQKSQLLLRVDGDVVGTIQLTEPIEDGVLRIPLKGEPEAAALAATLDGVAVSHETVLQDRELEDKEE